MRYLLLLGLAGTEAFAPAAIRKVAVISPRERSTSSARFFGVDPSGFHDIPQHLDTLREGLTTISISDAVDALPDPAALAAAPDPAALATDPAGLVPDAASADVAAQAANNGWFGFLTGPIEGLLQLIHSALVLVGLGDAWGLSIIALTVLIKVLTFPLSKSQLESTNKMQKLQPAIKEIQKKYESNQEVMNQKVAEFYQKNEINPLAGCIPSLVQIPVFIGLYRGVLTLAKENKLDEPFLWLPNLEGPTYGADPTHGSDWILKGWVDGVPSLGWEDTVAFLILPVFLVISQFVSMELMQPKTDDPNQQQSNAFLKVLPLMIGWFSLNVPAALCIYWVTNNIITTATSLAIRNSMNAEPVAAATTSSSTAVAEPPAPTIFAPPREKPAGFSTPAAPSTKQEVKPITPIDAEIVAEDTEEIEGGEVEEVTGESEVVAETQQSGAGMDSAPKGKRSGGRKKKRRKKRKN